MARKRLQITVIGRVQGVGFRPAVYRYAREEILSGTVYNAPEGVVIEVEGEEENISAFIEKLKKKPPAQAQIDSIQVKEIPPAGSRGFHITESQVAGFTLADVPPDLATCKECRCELFNVSDRRFGYPFINCVDCGPRFTIIEALPYDRERTTMKRFHLCPQCETEYNDPRDRRFDAQPNACSACGPHVTLINGKREQVPGDAIVNAAKLLKEERIVAVKGVGGYHIACSALSDAAVAELRNKKARPHKALAVMFSSVDEVKKYCFADDVEEKILLGAASPIVILRRRPDSQLSALVSPDTSDVGAFLAYTPIHHLLLANVHPLVMTSANSAEEPIVKDEEELQKILGTIVDFALIHDRPIGRRCDDSVVKNSNGKRIFFRRSRGFVPDPVSLPFEKPVVLACGGHLKNTFCITRGNQALLSQYIGDLESYETDVFYQKAIDDYLSLFNITPDVITFDLHPGYFSTRYALESPIPIKTGVQHHHAHIASCMIDNGITDTVIGVALDGTGYGTDGTLWGGEFLLADLTGFKRVGRFKQYPLPGGEEAVRNPVRMALSCCLSEQITDFNLFTKTYHNRMTPAEMDGIETMIKNKVNSPVTSSAGRLFDAVAALLDLCGAVTYEGQAAIRLQTIADTNVRGSYGVQIDAENGCEVLSFGPAINDIIGDLKSGISKGTISSRFHNTVAKSVSDMCIRLRTIYACDKVALSGGVFQNDLLLTKMVQLLGSAGFTVYTHERVPPNDGGICLGQAAVALAKLNR